MTSVNGQVEELRSILMASGDPPVSDRFLLGSNARFHLCGPAPEIRRKTHPHWKWGLRGPVRHHDRRNSIQPTHRRGAPARDFSWPETLAGSGIRDKKAALARLGKLFTKADAYDPLTLEIEVLDHQYELHQSVWQEAQVLRRNGRILELGNRYSVSGACAAWRKRSPTRPKVCRSPCRLS